MHKQTMNRKSEFERMDKEEGTPAREIRNGSRVCVKCEKSDLWCDCFMNAPGPEKVRNA